MFSNNRRDFPDGPVVGSPPSNTGLVPGQGTNILHSKGPLNPRVATKSPRTTRKTQCSFKNKKHRFTLLWFWRSEVQNQFCWARVKVLAGLVAQEALSGGSFPCLFKPVEATYSAWLRCLPQITPISCFCHHISHCSLWSPASRALTKNTRDYIRPIWIIEDKLCFSRSST